MSHCVLHLFLLIFGWTSLVYAGPSQIWRPGFSQLESEFLMPAHDQADGPADQPFWALPLKWDLLRYDLDKVNPVSGGACSKTLVFDSSFNQSKLDDYVKDCEPLMANGPKGLLENVAKTLLLRDRFKSHPMAQPVILNLPDQVRLRAHLFLQAFHERKPMVVLRAGIFSNSREYYPERHLVEFFYQQLGYHVLLLESMTSSDFIANNKTWAIVGFDEGLQNYYIGKKLKSSSEPLAKSISSLHFAALSMGGAGGFFAAYLQRQQPQDPYEKFLFFCPLMDFNSTFMHHRSSPVTNWVLEHVAARRLKFLKEKFQLNSQTSFILALESYFYQNYRAPMMQSYLQDVRISERQQKILNSANERTFFDLNQMDTELLQIRSPILVVTTDNDVIVPRFLNADRWVPQMQLASVPILQLKLSQGYHCSLPVPYNHQDLSKVFAQWFAASK